MLKITTVSIVCVHLSFHPRIVKTQEIIFFFLTRNHSLSENNFCVRKRAQTPEARLDSFSSW